MRNLVKASAQFGASKRQIERVGATLIANK